ncbi:MAG TPA: BrnT family toxin [Blastocatellia bacterium]|nr:BrnT family toxin [Blastocatellia bacterium]
MKFTWDERKSTGNARKHGVSFSEAATVFQYPLAVTGADPAHSRDEFPQTPLVRNHLGEVECRRRCKEGVQPR